MVSLNDFSGRNVVVYFYPRDDTSGCTREALDFTALRADFAETATDIVGISADSVASHIRFKNKHSLALTLVADEAKQTLNAYGVWVEKSMYGRKYMGIERATFLIGKSGRIVRIWRNVKVPNHANDVLEAVRRL